MANKSGKRASKVGAFEERDWQDVWRLLGKAGSEEELFRRIRKRPPAKPPGRRRSDYFKDISISDGPKGLKVVRFSVGPENYVVVVDPEPRTAKPGLLKYERPHTTISEIVKTLWPPSDPSHVDEEAATLWLIRKLRKAGLKR